VKFRSRVDISAEILEAAKNGELKTRIMYAARVSVKQLNPYLDLLVENGMLEYQPKERLYRTSEKGNIFLDNYQKAWQVLFHAKKKPLRREAIPIVQKNDSQSRN
jgi:predicted transcriptional regulator